MPRQEIELTEAQLSLAQALQRAARIRNYTAVAPLYRQQAKAISEDIELLLEMSQAIKNVASERGNAN